MEDEWSKANCLPRRPADDGCEFIGLCTRTEATHWFAPAARVAPGGGQSYSSVSGDDRALWKGELLDGEGDEQSVGSSTRVLLADAIGVEAAVGVATPSGPGERR